MKYSWVVDKAILGALQKKHLTRKDCRRLAADDPQWVDYIYAQFIANEVANLESFERHCDLVAENKKRLTRVVLGIWLSIISAKTDFVIDGLCAQVQLRRVFKVKRFWYQRSMELSKRKAAELAVAPKLTAPLPQRKKKDGLLKWTGLPA
jgi:hypothetical protein